MKHRALLLVAACCLYSLATSAQAQTAPLACLPKQWASTGSEYLTGTVDGYGWFGWTCNLGGGRTKLEGFVWEPGYVLKHPTAAGNTPNQIFRAYYAANVSSCVSPGCDAARRVMRATLMPE